MCYGQPSTATYSSKKTVKNFSISMRRTALICIHFAFLNLAFNTSVDEFLSTLHDSDSNAKMRWEYVCARCFHSIGYSESKSFEQFYIHFRMICWPIHSVPTFLIILTDLVTRSKRIPFSQFLVSVLFSAKCWVLISENRFPFFQLFLIEWWKQNFVCHFCDLFWVIWWMKVKWTVFIVQ